MRLTINQGHAWPQERLRWLLTDGRPRIRSDVYGWVIVPHRPSEAGQTVKLCGVHDVRLSIERCRWRYHRTESIKDAAGQLLSMSHEQSARCVAEFQDSGLHVRSYCYRRGEGPATYIPGTADPRISLPASAYLAAKPPSTSLGIMPYGEPSVILLDRRGDYDSFTLGTSAGTTEHGWHQMGWRPSLLVKPSLGHADNGPNNETAHSSVSWDIQPLSSGRVRWLLDQSGDAVPDISYFLRKHPEWFRITNDQ